MRPAKRSLTCVAAIVAVLTLSTAVVNVLETEQVPGDRAAEA